MSAQTLTAATERLDAESRASTIDSFSRLLDQHCPRGAGFDNIGVEDGQLWSVLVENEWLHVGASEANGGVGLDLFDLALLAIEWGRRLPALPFTTTVLAHRWGLAESGQDARKFSFALPLAGGVVAPFGGEGVVLDAEIRNPVKDEFSFSLPLLKGEGSAQLSAERISEIQVLLAAEALGAAEENFERATAYSQERVAYGNVISGFQALRHQMADMVVDLEMATSALFWAISTQGAERERALGMAIHRAQKVCADSIQIFGGIGFTWELGTHRYLRHAMAIRELTHLSLNHADTDAVAGAEGGVDGPEEAAFRAQARAWVEKALSELKVEDPESGHDETEELRIAWGKTLARGGYSALGWPKEYGGAGLSAAKVAIFSEECARAHAPNQLNTIGVNLAGPAIIAAGTEEQKKRYLPGIVSGEVIWCEGFSEPNAGSDLAAARTTARWDGEKFLINGSKIWTSHAHRAQKCYLLTKTSEEAPRHQNLTVFLFDMNQPGVEIVPLAQINGRADFNQVFFNDAVATMEDVLGEVNGGWQLSTAGAKGVRSAGAATAVWHHYAFIRLMIDQLASDAAAQGREDQRIAGYRERLELLWWHIARCAEMVPIADSFRTSRAATQCIKITWSALYQEVAEAGFAGYVPESRQFWRDAYFEARPVKIYGASCELQRNIIADQVLRLKKRL